MSQICRLRTRRKMPPQFHFLHHASSPRNQLDLARVRVLLIRPPLRWPSCLKEGTSCVLCFSVPR